MHPDDDYKVQIEVMPDGSWRYQGKVDGQVLSEVAYSAKLQSEQYRRANQRPLLNYQDLIALLPIAVLASCILSLMMQIATRPAPAPQPYYQPQQELPQ